MRRERRSENRGTPWVLALIGLVIGLAGALWLTWAAWPVQYFNTDPADLRPELKQDHLVLIGSSFGVNEDLPRAQRRLRWLGSNDDEAARLLAGLTKQFTGLSSDVAMVRGMSKLAYALGARESQIMVYLVTPTPTLTSTPTETPVPTDTPPPTAAPTDTATPRWTPQPTSVGASSPSRVTPVSTNPATETPVPLPDYEVESKSFSCEPSESGSQQIGLLAVRVRAAGRATPGVTALSVSWEGDEDEFFTGLKPDKGADYADFEMQPGIEYLLTVDHGKSQPVKVSFRDKDCMTEMVTGTLPVWEVVFQKRKVSGTN